MEILVLWVIVGVVLRIVGASKQNQRKRQARTGPQTPRPRGPRQASAGQPGPAKKQGLLDTFVAQLREIEEQEKRKAQGLPPRETKPRKQTDRTLREERMDEEAAIEQFREKKDRKFQQRLEEGSLREPGEDYYTRPRPKAGFSFETLEKKFPNPAQRMIVYTEIMDKPIGLRTRR